ncbi:MAG: DEAD/DEAH box helicase [Burkholderiales bacterium]|nr:DEAD/DEAH box helicase [Burkholderiales bacterium]
MSFATLGLCEPLVRAVNECGYTEPTPIQVQAIPAVLKGGDLLAAAQTGTGKTAGFTLPILQRLEMTPAVKLPNGRHPIRVLVLTPTRELAAQIHESVRDYGRHLHHTAACVFGGVNINPQITQLRGRVDILVATPGRLLDHVGQRTVDLSHVEILVLDEADRMLDMGFIHDIRKVLKLLPARRQNLLFSATFSDEIRTLTQGLLNNPATVEVARRNAPAEAVEQTVIEVEKGAKRAVLSHLIRTRQWFQVLVFTRTKHGANRLAEQLGKDGIEAMAIHGNKSQNARTRALAQFKEGSLQVLVATDIAARGLDIEELPQVVNYELPNVPEDYVHRIGRTGRAGASGRALSLVASDERSELHDIERLLKRQLSREVIDDFDIGAANAAARAAGPERDERDDRPRGGGRGQRGSPRSGPSRPAGAGAGASRPSGAPGGGHRGASSTSRPAGASAASSGGARGPGGNPGRGAGDGSSRGTCGPGARSGGPGTRSGSGGGGYRSDSAPRSDAPRAAEPVRSESPAAPRAADSGAGDSARRPATGLGAALMSVITRPFSR